MNHTTAAQLAAIRVDIAPSLAKTIQVPHKFIKAQTEQASMAAENLIDVLDDSLHQQVVQLHVMVARTAANGTSQIDLGGLNSVIAEIQRQVAVIREHQSKIAGAEAVLREMHS